MIAQSVASDPRARSTPCAAAQAPARQGQGGVGPGTPTLNTDHNLQTEQIDLLASNQRETVKKD